MKKDRWVWMGHPGHFICSYACRFHLNTYVGGYIVSTVGEWWPERAIREIHAKIHDPVWFDEHKALLGDNFDSAYMKKFGYEDIGCDRKYETMVFKARKAGHKCCPYEADVSRDMDMKSYNKPEDAFKGHMQLCEKWGNRGKAKDDQDE